MGISSSRLNSDIFLMLIHGIAILCLWVRNFSHRRLESLSSSPGFPSLSHGRWSLFFFIHDIPDFSHLRFASWSDPICSWLLLISLHIWVPSTRCIRGWFSKLTGTLPVPCVFPREENSRSKMERTSLTTFPRGGGTAHAYRYLSVCFHGSSGRHGVSAAARRNDDPSTVDRWKCPLLHAPAHLGPSLHDGQQFSCLLHQDTRPASIKTRFHACFVALYILIL